MWPLDTPTNFNMQVGRRHSGDTKRHPVAATSRPAAVTTGRGLLNHSIDAEAGEAVLFEVFLKHVAELGGSSVVISFIGPRPARI